MFASFFCIKILNLEHEIEVGKRRGSENKKTNWQLRASRAETACKLCLFADDDVMWVVLIFLLRITRSPRPTPKRASEIINLHVSPPELIRIYCHLMQRCLHGCSIGCSGGVLCWWLVLRWYHAKGISWPHATDARAITRKRRWLRHQARTLAGMCVWLRSGVKG